MTPERAYLIVSPPGAAGPAVPDARPLPAGHPAARPPRRRPGVVARPGDRPLVRRHRPGRHRAPAAGPFRPAGLHAAPHRTSPLRALHRPIPPQRVADGLGTGTGAARRRRAGLGPHPGRHAVRADGTDMARYASLVVTLSALLVSGWFAATGATAFAQMVRP